MYSVDVREYAHGLALSTDCQAQKAAPRTTQPTDSAVNWIDRIHNMPEYFNAFYNTYAQSTNQVLEGNSNWLSDPTKGVKIDDGMGNISYCIPINKWEGSLSYTYPADLTTESQISPIAELAFRDYIKALEDSMFYFMPYFFTCINYDIPEAFWIGNYYNWYYNWGYSYSWDGRGNGNIYYSIEMNMELYDDGFSFKINEYNTAQSVLDGVAEFNNCINGILKDLPDQSSYYQAKYLNNWLTTHNCYSSAYYDQSIETPTIVWSPMSALKGSTGYNGPVCEGYARAFKILCDRIGIPAVLAVGNACSYPGAQGEAHMWNEVQMNDGKWYAVDVTWNDPPVYGLDNVAYTGYENDEWFMLGKYSMRNGMTFAESHPFSLLFDSDYSNIWDCTIQSFIEDYPYDVANFIDKTFIDRKSVTVHSLTGTVIGRYDSMEKALEQLPKGIYIINNRKIVRP